MRGFVRRFGRPYGAQGILRMLTQGFVRCRELHPGLLSLLPPGAFSEACGAQTPSSVFPSGAFIAKNDIQMKMPFTRWAQ
jgi:hypothetical protein